MPYERWFCIVFALEIIIRHSHEEIMQSCPLKTSSVNLEHSTHFTETYPS